MQIRVSDTFRDAVPCLGSSAASPQMIRTLSRTNGPDLRRGYAGRRPPKRLADRKSTMRRRPVASPGLQECCCCCRTGMAQKTADWAWVGPATRCFCCHVPCRSSAAWLPYSAGIQSTQRHLLMPVNPDAEALETVRHEMVALSVRTLGGKAAFVGRRCLWSAKSHQHLPSDHFLEGSSRIRSAAVRQDRVRMFEIGGVSTLTATLGPIGSFGVFGERGFAGLEILVNSPQSCDVTRSSQPET